MDAEKLRRQIQRLLPGYLVTSKGEVGYVHGSDSRLAEARSVLQRSGWAVVDCNTQHRPCLMVGVVLGVTERAKL